MKIVTASFGDYFSKNWGDLWSECVTQDPLYGTCNLNYYKAYWRTRSFIDLSFVVASPTQPILGVLLTVNRDDNGLCQLSAYGQPIHFLENSKVTDKDRKQAYKLLKQKLKETFEQEAPNQIIYRDYLERGKLSPLSKMLMDMGAKAEPVFIQMIDLYRETSLIRSDLNKTYKWNVNWGEKNLDIQILDNSNVVDKDIEEFRCLHVAAAGRETRSKDSWRAQFEMVQNNEAFIVFGRLSDRLVTAALFSFSRDVCVYGVSASDRELFDKPLSHILLWRAICTAKNLGCSSFECGEVFFLEQTIPAPEKKVLGISRFKRNFGGDISQRLSVVWSTNINANKKIIR
ncbi:MAG: hypothetical protein V7776_15860 [Halopseudomonas aestusnigri]